MSSQFYITTPIYYVNAAPHIGHAYSTIVADVINRFHVLEGYETFFLTGTDEHGDKIVQASRELGEAPKDYVDRVSNLFRALWPKLRISNDYFIRTTDYGHQETVKYILNRVHEGGDIYFSEYKGNYCFGCERFLMDKELIEGKCPDHMTEPEVIAESNYFFRMSSYQDWLIDHINRNPDFIRPERYRNEVMAFLKDPLEDLCISRPKSRLEWGITLPFDENYVTYVWFDALINYISALGYPEGDDFKKFWPASQHIIAKDILKPHGIYWPCMLKSAGIEPFQHLNVHGYWNIKEGKMSKSRGNVVRPLDLVDIYGLDAFRYFLMRDMVFGLDSEFSEEGLISRINSDLANDLGNLVSRSTTMVCKYFKGEPPAPSVSQKADEELKEHALKHIDTYCVMMRGMGFHKALMVVWEIIGQVNKYIDTMAPWVLAKSDKERLGTVMYHITEILKILSALIWPFMPETGEKLQHQLGLETIGRALKFERIRQWGKEERKKPVTRAKALFPRIDRPEAPSSGTGKTKERDMEKSPVVSLKEFQKLDLRVGTIKTAEVIPGSRKLLKMTVDLGEERTIVAGLAEYYSGDDLEGKQAIVVMNLEPVKLMGVESHGMVLASGDDKGLGIIMPDKAMKPGSRVK